MYDWRLLSLVGTVPSNDCLDDCQYRLPDMLGYVWPRGDNSEQAVTSSHQVPFAGTTGGTTLFERFDRIRIEWYRATVFRP